MRQIVLPILIVTISFSLFGQSVLHTKLKLGGPIDYGIFTSQGMTWDKRKPNCYSEDVKSYVPSPKPLPKKSK